MITITTQINATKEKVWECWTNPIHVKEWNQASSDWHTPSAESDLKIGGKFVYRMEAKDGSFGFDFWGVFTQIEPHSRLKFTLGDERKVEVEFKEDDGGVLVIEQFEPELENPVEMQQMGWQLILDNFKSYTEKQ